MTVPDQQPHHPQLPLGVRLHDRATFASYHPPGNEELLRLLADTAAGDAAEPVWLWGAGGSGRSHLLHAACHAVAERDARPAYLDLASIATAAALEGMGGSALVCLDNVAAWAGDAELEAALFGLVDSARRQRQPLLFAAGAAPLAAGFRLPDLTSRLAHVLVYRVRALDDAGCVAALQLRAGQRGLQLPESTARFVLARHPRDMASLFALLEHLDDAALRAHRRLTIPFVRSVLGD